MWHLFKIGRIPGTNFIINTDYVKSIGGWRNGALTEDTDISFKIMESGKLIALAYNSEAFQQEPETVPYLYDAAVNAGPREIMKWLFPILKPL